MENAARLLLISSVYFAASTRFPLNGLNKMKNMFGANSSLVSFSAKLPQLLLFTKNVAFQSLRQKGKSSWLTELLFFLHLSFR